MGVKSVQLFVLVGGGRVFLCVRICVWEMNTFLTRRLRTFWPVLAFPDNLIDKFQAEGFSLEAKYELRL